MTIFCSTPNTQWVNSDKSYWIPLRVLFTLVAYIRTAVTKATMAIGRKWTKYDVSSEMSDGHIIAERIDPNLVSERADEQVTSERIYNIVDD